MDAHKHVTARGWYSCAITVPVSTGSYNDLYDLAIAAMDATNDAAAIRALKYRAIVWGLKKISGGTDLTYTVRIGNTTAGTNADAQIIAKNTNEEVSSNEFPGDGVSLKHIFVKSTGAAFDACLYWGAAVSPVSHGIDDN